MRTPKAPRDGREVIHSPQPGRVMPILPLEHPESLAATLGVMLYAGEEYRGFESHSLRQVVRDSGESVPGARSGGEFFRHSAGFWVSVWAFPKRRHPGGALDRATGAGFSAADCGGSG